MLLCYKYKVNPLNFSNKARNLTFSLQMLIFRMKQKKVKDIYKVHSNSIGLSKKFLKWYLKGWRERNL